VCRSYSPVDRERGSTKDLIRYVDAVGMATRRSLLASCGQVTAAGALLGVAGCIERSASGRGGDPATETETDDPATATEAGGAGDERPDFGGHLDDANGMDGSVADRTGEETVTIEVGAGDSGYAFSPPAVHVDAGATVRWEWTGEGGAHNVVSVGDGPLDSGSVVGEPGVRYEFTFEADGVYNYTCLPHRSVGMRGSVVVGTDYPTTADPLPADDSDDAADEQVHYLDDANGYGDGKPADRTGQDVVTIRVGAGEDGFAFDPALVVVDVGTTVRWEWTGEGGAHNVVARDEAFDSGAPEASDDVSFEYTFDAAGSHMYACRPHESLGMKGAVAVTPEDRGTETPSATREAAGSD
jgi:halocyanin-like protein